MEKEAVNKPFTWKNRAWLLFYGTAMFFVLAAMSFAIIIYLAYFFKTDFFKISFRAVLILIAVLTYYILIKEFINYFKGQR